MERKQNIKLVKGQAYDLETLIFVGWTGGDGSGADGYVVFDYFSDGTYAGPDIYGIEPILREMTDIEYSSREQL